MDSRTLHILEFDKIVALLSARAQSAPGRELCEALLPSPEMAEVAERQSQTDDAVRILLAKGTPPLTGLSDVRPAASRAAAGAVLNCSELLRVSALLRGAARLKAFVPSEHSGSSSAIVSGNALYGAMSRLAPVPDLEHAISNAILGEDEISDREIGRAHV